MLQLHVRTVFNQPLPLRPQGAKLLRQGFSRDRLQDVAVEAREAGLGEQVDDGRHLELIRSFLAKKTAERTAAPPKRTRKKRRAGTWTDVIGGGRPASGRAPPLG
jgi:hypothetical protein